MLFVNIMLAFFRSLTRFFIACSLFLLIGTDLHIKIFVCMALANILSIKFLNFFLFAKNTKNKIRCAWHRNGNRMERVLSGCRVYGKHDSPCIL